MSHSKHKPADNTTTELYAKRKALHPMPNPLKQQILTAAKTKLEQQPKPASWLRPPLWAASFAAVLTIVITVQFLPHNAEMTLPPPPLTPPEYDQAAGPQVEMASALADNQIQSAPIQAPAARADAPAAKPAPEQQHKRFKRHDLASEQSLAANAKFELSVNGAVVVHAKLLPKVAGQSRQVQDCYGSISELKGQDLDSFKDNQWLDIHYFEDGTIMRILPAPESQKCEPKP